MSPVVALENPPKHEGKGKAAAPPAAPPAKAAPAKAAPAKTSPNATPVNKSMLELVTGLTEAKILLDTAIHDYDGHRASAVKHVKHAIEELTPLIGNQKVVAAAKKSESAPSLTTTPGEIQAQSDAQLKQAREMIAELGGHIPTQHGKALDHAKKALEELDVALKVK
jgi:hypothetical protein